MVVAWSLGWSGQFFDAVSLCLAPHPSPLPACAGRGNDRAKQRPASFVEDCFWQDRAPSPRQRGEGWGEGPDTQKQHGQTRLTITGAN